MLKVHIYRDSEKKINKYEAFGHCNFEEAGKDIVCAAASVLLQVSILGLNKYCGLTPEFNISSGKLSCLLPSIDDPIKIREVQAVLETMVIGLKEIKNKYPGYIKLKEIKGG
jgi:hypothetical protein